MIFSPPFPVVLISSLGILALGIAVWREFSPRRRKLSPSQLHYICLCLKIATLLLLVLCLFNPAKQFAVEIPKEKCLILLDTSASMSLSTDGENTRWDEGKEFVDQAIKRSVSAGIPAPEIVTFASEPGTLPLPETATGTKSNLAGALARILTGDSFYQHIVVVSDGRIHDREELPTALSNARIPISTKLIGVEKNFRNAEFLTLKHPQMVRANSPVSVRTSIEASGFAPTEKLILTLEDPDGNVVAKSEINPSGDGRPIDQALSFNSGLRTTRYKLSITPSGEPDLDPGDNETWFTVEIATKKIRVLYAEGTHEKRPVGIEGHMWNNMEHKTRAWAETGEIEFECLSAADNRNKFPNLVGVTFHNGEMQPDPSRDFPKTREELNNYDVLLICGIQKNNFSTEQMQWVYDWVLQRGGGFLMGGGGNSFDRGEYDKTLWERIIPVDMKAYGHGLYNVEFEVDIPRPVRNHPIWTILPDPTKNNAVLKTLPGFSGMNRVLRAKPGAQLLAVRRGGTREPIIAAQSYGRGRSIAFLPDTNGAWGRQFLDWGPPEDPDLGTFIHLGQGKDFVLDEQAGIAPPGPAPEHPGSWYGQFWVNVVQWLAKDSIRWQRDKLAGRCVSALARPGEKLAVAAEVLTVSEIDELLSLNVGARIDYPGARRVRLHYDRDLREFIGNLTFPENTSDQAEVAVFFDANINGEVVSQSTLIGINQGNPEYRNPSPDPEFMRDLATSTNGTVIEKPSDVISILKEVQKQSEMKAHKNTRVEPLWSQRWIWAMIAIFFCVEWLLRRRGGKTAQLLVIAAVCIMGSISVQGEEKSLESWIDQLGADRVRLRDQADEFLRSNPKAYSVVNAAAETTKNKEIQIRAESIARYLRSTNRWRLIASRVGHVQNKEVLNRGLVLHPDKTVFYSRGRDHIREFDIRTLEPKRTFGYANFRIGDRWLRHGLVNAIAITPDGETFVSSNEHGEIVLTATDTHEELNLFGDPEAEKAAARGVPNNRGTIFGFAFFPGDSKRLLTSERLGVRLWDLTTRKQKWRFASKDPCFAMVLSPEQDKILVSVDGRGPNDYMLVLDSKTGRQIKKWPQAGRLSGFVFDSTGRQLLASDRYGMAHVYHYDAKSGTIKKARSYGPNGRECYGVAWGPKETSILTTSLDSNCPLKEWDLETGKEIWAAEPIADGLANIIYIEKNRIAVSGGDGIVTIWEFTDL